MLSYSNVYADISQPRAANALYAAGLSQIAHAGQSGQLNSIRATLGLTALSLVNTGVTAIPQMCVAKDSVGATLAFGEFGDPRLTWADVLTNEVTRPQGWNGSLLRSIYDWANTIAALSAVTSLEARPIQVCGYGLGGAMACFLGEILKKAGKNVRVCYIIGQPRWCTEGLSQDIEFYTWALQAYWDPFRNCPPGIMTGTGRDDPDVFGAGPLYGVGHGGLWLGSPDDNHSIQMAQAYRANRIDAPRSWPERLPDEYSGWHRLSLYIDECWNRMQTRTQQLMREWVDIFNSNYGFNLLLDV